jgi:hypothetical protein
MTEFSDFVVQKAMKIVKAGGVKQLAGDNWEVTSTSGKKYAVLLTEYGTGVCSCLHGSNRVSSTCSHVAAVSQVKEIEKVNTGWGDLQKDHFALEIQALRKLGHC